MSEINKEIFRKDSIEYKMLDSLEIQLRAERDSIKQNLYQALLAELDRIKTADSLEICENCVGLGRKAIERIFGEPIEDKAQYREGDIEKFFGCDPDFTCGLSTEEYLHKIRSGDEIARAGSDTEDRAVKILRELKEIGFKTYCDTRIDATSNHKIREIFARHGVSLGENENQGEKGE